MKKILVLGAGFLQTFIIQKAKQLGYYVLAADADKNAIGFKYADKCAVVNITDEKACLNYAMEEKIDGVITAATDYGVLSASYVAREMNLPGLNYDTAKLIKNKYKIKECLFLKKADDTKQIFEAKTSTDIDAIIDEIEFPVIVKPSDGSGSRGVTKVENADGLYKACETAIQSSRNKSSEIESFVYGDEYGVESFVYNNKVYVLAVIKKYMTPPPNYAELGHSFPSGLNHEQEQKIKNVAENAIKALGINFGAVNMDILLDKNMNVHIVDVGARMGGNLIGSHIIPNGTGIDYMGNIIRAALGDNVDFNSLPINNSCVATKLLAFDEGIIKNMPDMEKIEKQYSVKIYHHMKKGDKINKYKTNLDGCGYLLSVSNSINDSEKNVLLAYDFISKYIF